MLGRVRGTLAAHAGDAAVRDVDCGDPIAHHPAAAAREILAQHLDLPMRVNAHALLGREQPDRVGRAHLRLEGEDLGPGEAVGAQAVPPPKTPGGGILRELGFIAVKMKLACLLDEFGRSSFVEHRTVALDRVGEDGP
jgi:hypothetical protein